MIHLHVFILLSRCSVTQIRGQNMVRDQTDEALTQVTKVSAR
jgi:hypothetical protein